MKTSKSIIAVGALLVITFLVMGATDFSHNRDDSIAQLKARISSLEKRIEALEKKLQTSTIKRSSETRGTSRPSREQGLPRSSATRRPSRPSREQGLPRDWRKKEFNGVPYYIVPLNQKQSRSRQRSSTKSSR